MGFLYHHYPLSITLVNKSGFSMHLSLLGLPVTSVPASMRHGFSKPVATVDVER